MTRSTCHILDIPVARLSQQQVIAQIIEIAASKNRSKSEYIATLNLDFLVNAYPWQGGTEASKQLLRALQSATLVTADGMPIVWLSKLLGAPVPARVTGADLVPELAKVAAEQGLSLYILGGRQEQMERVIKQLKTASPHLEIAGYDTRQVIMSAEQDASSDIVQKINDSGAKILLLCLGNPKQELWFAKHRDQLNVPVAIGVGGTLNFISGCVKRAPKWMRKSGLEWLYRLWREPKRLLRRYTKGLIRFPLIALKVLYRNYRHPIETTQDSVL